MPLIERRVRVYVDGSSSNRRKTGAWAAVMVVPGEQIHTRSGKLESPTNNQEAELRAAVEGLSWASEYLDWFEQIEVISDSLYVVRGITEYLPMWRSVTHWMTSNDEPVKFRSLWERLAGLDGAHVVWTHVRGHKGNVYNEMADRLASCARLVSIEFKS